MMYVAITRPSKRLIVVGFYEALPSPVRPRPIVSRWIPVVHRSISVHPVVAASRRTSDDQRSCVSLYATFFFSQGHRTSFAFVLIAKWSFLVPRSSPD